MTQTKTYIKEPRYITTFTVLVSRLSAALDMMRYDACYPASQEDAYKLARLDQFGKTDADRTITFIRAGRNSRGPTEARWTSFGCRIVAVHRP